MSDVTITEDPDFLGRSHVAIQTPAESSLSLGMEGLFDASEMDGVLYLFPCRCDTDYVLTCSSGGIRSVLVGDRPRVPDTADGLDRLQGQLEDYYRDMRVVTIRDDYDPPVFIVTYCNGQRLDRSTPIEVEAHAIVSAADVVDRLRASFSEA
jgi:hypothetical protein